MPIATIEGPRIENIELKRKMAEEISVALARAFEMPKEKMIVLIKENDPGNVALGGTLVSDMKPV